MSDHDDLRRSSGRSPHQMMVVGLVVTIVSGISTLVFSIATVLAANPCGTFGDACDDYGTTSNEFVVVLALTFLSILAFVIGLVLTIKGVSRRHRRHTRWA